MSNVRRLVVQAGRVTNSVMEQYTNILTCCGWLTNLLWCSLWHHVNGSMISGRPRRQWQYLTDPNFQRWGSQPRIWEAREQVCWWFCLWGIAWARARTWDTLSARLVYMFGAAEFARRLDEQDKYVMKFENLYYLAKLSVSRRSPGRTPSYKR